MRPGPRPARPRRPSPRGRRSRRSAPVARLRRSARGRRPAPPGRATPATRRAGPAGCPPRCSVGWTCTSSGRTRWATERASRACFTASEASSAWSDPAWTTVEDTATSANAALEIEVLERASAEHLRRHLSRHRDDRRPVDLGVVQARSAGWSSPDPRCRGRPPAGRSASRRPTPRTRPRPRGGCRCTAGDRPLRAGGARRRSRGWSARPCRRPCRRPTRRASRRPRRPRCARGVSPSGAPPTRRRRAPRPDGRPARR